MGEIDGMRRVKMIALKLKQKCGSQETAVALIQKPVMNPVMFFFFSVCNRDIWTITLG